MSFTPVNGGDPVSETLEIVLEELKVALNEREAILGLTETTDWSTDTQVLVRAKDYLDRIRAAIPAMIDGVARFVNPTGYDAFGGIEDLLDIAGYPDGWIATAGLIVSDRTPWLQLQEVFAVLYVFHTYETIVNGGLIGGSETRRNWASPVGNTNNEVAWDTGVASTPVGASGYRGMLEWRGTFQTSGSLYGWQFKGPNATAIYDTSGYSAASHGAFIRALLEIDFVGTGTGSTNVTFAVSGSGDTFVVSETGSLPSQEVVLTTGFSFGSDYVVTYSVTTSEPASVPSTPVNGDPTILSCTMDTARFYFDVTSILTYG